MYPTQDATLFAFQNVFQLKGCSICLYCHIGEVLIFSLVDFIHHNDIVSSIHMFIIRNTHPTSDFVTCAPASLTH